MPLKLLFLALLAWSSSAVSGPSAASATSISDIVIYGCSPAGIAAAVEARRMKKSVTLICRDRHIGGMTANGLGMADTGNHNAIGGLAKQFYRDVRSYYASRGVNLIAGQSKTGVDDKDGMYVFEPHVAEAVFEDWLKKSGIVPIRSAPMQRDGRGVVKRGNHILSLTLRGGRQFSGRIFIDASYEGDLMAEAGVSFTTGRESNTKYGETHNGVQNAKAAKHQFTLPVDPFKIPGDRKSGLLPRIELGPSGRDGAGDARIQAYTYRLCMTKMLPIRAPLTKPANYDPQQYELLGRYLDAGWRDLFSKYDPIPNQKTDTNNNGAFSMDNIGKNYGYPTGTDSDREIIASEHRSYQQGLLWFMQNDPRSPADVRAAMKPWGLCKDEFVDNGNWPREMYIREARRMTSDFIMTERHLRGEIASPSSIGLGSYNLDSHNVRRFVDANGHARNEGDIQVGLGGDYVISYGAVVPKRAEADNLFVPVALSASHIAYGSLRMEPVFMILGQSAATAAALAIDGKLAVQDVPYGRLAPILMAQGQILETHRSWSAALLAIAVGHKRTLGAVAVLALSIILVILLALLRAKRR